MDAIQKLTENNLLALIVPLLLFLVFFSWNIILHLKLRKMIKRNEKMFAGKKMSSLEDLILANSKNLQALDKDIQELFNISNQIHNLAFKGIHKTGVIRFNPFKDVGGDQSFAVALLNGRNDGMVLSSLHTREGTRVYSKSIINGETEKHPLTEEEKKAIRMALDSLNPKSQKAKSK